MHLDFGLKLEQSQKLIMTPQLRQAIEILQLSSQDLSTMVEQAILENPMLETEARSPAEQELEDYGQAEKNTDTDTTLSDYFDWAEFFNDGTDPGYNSPGAKEKPSLEFFVANTVSLQEHLELQLHLSLRRPELLAVGRYLIGCIDSNGYLSCTIKEAAQATGMKPPIVEQVLALIQSFDPPGIGARDLRECLTIQLEQRNINYSFQNIATPVDSHLIRRIIEDHLDEVAAGKFKLIAEKTGSIVQAVQQAVDVIRSFDPKPGRAFGGAPASYIVPDVTVEKVNGEYVILLNDDLPHLTISPYYRRAVRDADDTTKKFVENRVNAAVWLIKSIEQRRSTLLHVMEAIIHFQRDFFDQGPQALKTLTMKKVADRVEVHESTVSRATANKYVDTPYGVFSLRSFFTAGVQGSDGDDVASANVKREIKELIGKEDATRPLSDQALADILKEKGITVSRRTVAKYREEMNIAASSKRKRY
ncbi:RNA polymerase factor sigma-54 [Propionispora vibrioides]|uniref:RNA polymerase, sigma 54 subunit, RpoN/SigL n=1 Tax=Propionispora vibrioides TaxID=112903 RepID=A0A1H8RQU7_9FIRM|nr:RNA polymerase factor sigma-54 [Propionispora vibrioides]SEO68841.1 RNA polymerase, sigma 54 subunit, RpoN/SigL [Propionispora vibrioides]